IDDLSRAKRNISITTVVVVGLMLLIIVPIYILTVSRTVAPIRQLSRASVAVAEGNLDQYVPVRTSDEVGELSESFNRMVADLRKYREELERWNQTLEERVAERGRQLAEAQAKLIRSTKLAAVGELAAGLAHELNNPLAGIYAFLQVFAEAVRAHGLKNLSDEDAESFEKNLVYVEREIQRCKSIIGSLLTFARVSEKNFTLLDLNSVLRETLGFMQSNLRKGNIRVETHFAEDLPPIKGDSSELQQVFLNMIVNARKAMPEGGKLIVGTGADKEDHLVRAYITDTGEGINPEIIDKIFDPFFTTRKPGEGTGLGLSISYGIIRDHNGEILVDSKVGEGSTFTVVLPAAATGEITEGVSASTSAAPENN
ncbi:MAG: HAMP domain-containing protein, partial [Candidatus Lindowbacteria bacterium]|nr:HAMP domain-containing protein [Candidatus Lindowbacteria bacterium]